MRHHHLFALALALAGCGPQVALDPGGTSGMGDDAATLAPTVSGTRGDGDDVDDVDDVDESAGADDAIIDDFAGADDGDPSGGCGDSDEPPCLLDVLVVVDNSATMADPQLALTRALVQLVERLEAGDGSLTSIVDVQMMFTTTDMGHPTCEAFQHPGYTPARGAPTATGCNQRIADFTGVATPAEVRPDACTAVCPVDVTPGDPFVAFVGDGGPSNLPAVEPRDVDGDGTLDSAAAQAVACLAPQGIDGCGYEAPLEAMVQALNPVADWNTGARPFLRPDSTLLVVVVSDESDCSTDDIAWMSDPIYWEYRPGGGPEPSSAMCWNAGTACVGPDADGIYLECSSTDAPLLPVSRYTSYLVDELREQQDREVLMVAITGVPLVTEVNAQPPYQPIVGGLDDLVIRDWRDGLYPRGDLLPADLRNGTSVADKAFELGIGPGCTELDRSGTAVQAIPSPRVHEVCTALDGDDRVRCCVESVCDPSPDLFCVDGWLSRLPGLGPKG